MIVKFLSLLVDIISKFNLIVDSIYEDPEILLRLIAANLGPLFCPQIRDKLNKLRDIENGHDDDDDNFNMNEDPNFQ